MKKVNFYNIVVVIAAVICVVFLFNAVKDLMHDRTLERVLSAELAAGKVSDKDLVGKVKHVYIEKRYWVADSFAFDDFEKKLQKSLDKAGFKLLSVSKSPREISYLVAERSSSNPVFRLTLIHRLAAVKPVPKPPEVKPSPARPKLAIVLDDWGYNTKNLDAVLQVGGPITLSVLPDLPYSTLVAQKAKERGFEVMIHMPMEPKAKIRLELTTLRTDMNDEEIRANLAKAFQSVPGAVGMNNHEGSKATEDRKLMDVVFGELKKNGMFFMDSVVTNDSICESAAKDAGVKFVKRSIFLDNESDPAYIKKQFEKAVSLALKTGYAVAIGHDRPNTVAAVKEMAPALGEKGIDLVFVSSLAR